MPGMPVERPESQANRDNSDGNQTAGGIQELNGVENQWHKKFAYLFSLPLLSSIEDIRAQGDVALAGDNPKPRGLPRKMLDANLT